VAEVAAEALYRLRGSSRPRWDFAIAIVRSPDDKAAPLAEIADALDTALGTEGRLIGTTAEGLDGSLMDGTRGHAWKEGKQGIMVIAVQLPEGEEQPAVPFALTKEDFPKISQVVMSMMRRVRVRGSSAPPTPRAWMSYLGWDEERPEPRGIILFVDPIASKYTVKTVLEGLDMAFPNTPKFGGVCADLPPGMVRLAKCMGGSFQQVEAGICGLILPSCLSLHTVTTPGSVRIGPELRLTRANGQVVEELNGKPAAEALAEVLKETGPLDKFLIERDGFFLGLEAASQPIDSNRNQVYDDCWGSARRAPSYAQLASQTIGTDWLVRTIEPMPNGAVVLRRDDLKQVPPRVGPAWLRCQLHVRNTHRAREEIKLMMQRYLGARMLLNNASQPIGALIGICASWAAAAEEEGAEVGYAELQEIFGEALPIARVWTNGEIAGPGVALGDSPRRTNRQGHTASCCILSYEPRLDG